MAAYGGVPVWHASAAVIDWAARRVKPVVAWTSQEHKRVDREIHRSLAGVGQRSSDDIEVGEVAIHVRRLVSGDEFKVIGPAIDVRKPGER